MAFIEIVEPRVLRMFLLRPLKYFGYTILYSIPCTRTVSNSISTSDQDRTSYEELSKDSSSSNDPQCHLQAPQNAPNPTV